MYQHKSLVTRNGLTAFLTMRQVGPKTQMKMTNLNCTTTCPDLRRKSQREQKMLTTRRAALRVSVMHDSVQITACGTPMTGRRLEPVEAVERTDDRLSNYLEPAWQQYWHARQQHGSRSAVVRVVVVFLLRGVRDSRGVIRCDSPMSSLSSRGNKEQTQAAGDTGEHPVHSPSTYFASFSETAEARTLSTLSCREEGCFA